MATYKLYCMMYIICPQNRHISERFGHYYNIIFRQLQTTPQKVTYCLSIFKIMLGIFPYYIAYNLGDFEIQSIRFVINIQYIRFSAGGKLWMIQSTSFQCGAIPEPVEYNAGYRFS